MGDRAVAHGTRHVAARLHVSAWLDRCDRHLANDGGWGVFIGLYVVYIVHAYFYFRSKTTPQTAILFGALVVLLTCNVVGCHEMIHSH